MAKHGEHIGCRRAALGVARQGTESRIGSAGRERRRLPAGSLEAICSPAMN